MERRIILAFALSFLVFTLWVRIFPPPEPPAPSDDITEARPGTTAEASPGGASPDVQKDDKKSPGSETTESEEEKEISASLEGDETAEMQTSYPRIEASSERTVSVDTPLFRASFTNRGARIQSLVLKDYLDSDGEPYELVVLGPSGESDRYPLDVAVDGAPAKLSDSLFESSVADLSLASGESREVVFSWARDGWEVSKRFAFHADRYDFDVEISARHRGAEVDKSVALGPGVGDETADSRYVGVDKAVLMRSGEPVFWDAGDLDELVSEGGFEAAGLSSHYFVSLVLPVGSPTQIASLSKTSWQDNEGAGNRDLILAAIDFPSEPARFTAFMGPKRLENLEALGPGFGGIIEYGDWLKVVAIPLRSALMWVYGFVGNYGWAIVVLTLLINVVLAPIKHHSYVSMKKMQKLSPQTKKIQEKYKKLKATDPKRQEMNQEMMALYKKHNVSPMSGCLPMLLTIPFFFAFYRLLMASIELRQAPFFGWIQDLSQHDPFFVLPILMGVTQYGMHRLTPNTSMDPTQAKIMGFMPLFITFLLAWAPAGLVLYWFANNVVSMGQQITTNRWLQRKDERASAEAKEDKARKKKKKEKG